MDIGRENRDFSDARPILEPRGEAALSSEPRHLLDEALSWIVRLKSGEATDVDLEALQRWREASPLHEEAFRDAARLWRRVRVAAQELAEETRAEAAGADEASRAAVAPRWSWRGALTSFGHRPRR
jgi:ferric-dicitrate binding protein FerR (iron transport regulator)